MKKEQRIFIKNLPETATSKDIETIFSKYGEVFVADIKKRTSVSGPCTSKFFAYVTVNIEDHSLQKCFKYFANNLWHGQNIELQIAKPNFLDRLKQEREELCKGVEKDEHVIGTLKSMHNDVKDSMEEPLLKKRKNKAAEGTSVGKKVTNVTKLNAEISISLLKAELTDETSINGELQNKKNADFSQSELKRVQSVNQMVKEYRLQKSAIKAALSNIDFKPGNKIIFDEIGALGETSKLDSSRVRNEKKQLFENDDDSEHDFNFAVETTFSSKKGKELFELQSKYKNDRRFVLNERFIEDDESNGSEIKNLEEIPLKEEKKQQFEILEQVLGNKLKSKTLNNEKDCFPKGGMLRFDPMQSEHLQYELKNTDSSQKIKKKRKNSQNPFMDVDVEIPESKVSKQVFYQVSDDLKGTLQNDEKFSLLNLYGQHEKPENHEKHEEHEKNIKPVNINLEINPFCYDSSEDEIEEMLSKDEKTLDKNESCGSKFWTDSFFFRNDDYRLQEGLDFLKRIASEKKDEFMQLRKNLKEIVKAKVRNNHRNNRAFKKKLGGSKRKKNYSNKKSNEKMKKQRFSGYAQVLIPSKRTTDHSEETRE